MSAVPDAASARRALAGLVDDGLGDDDVRRIYAKMGVNGKADLLEKVSSAI